MRKIRKTVDSRTYRYRDAIKLPSIGIDELQSGHSAGVFLEQPGQTRSYHRSTAAFLDDPDEVNLFQDLESDIITCPPAFIGSATDARVTGYRTVLTRNGLFFNDDSAIDSHQRRLFLTEFSLLDPFNEETGLNCTGQAGGFKLSIGTRSIERLEGTVVLLSSTEPSNYGSLLFRTLPKLRTMQAIQPMLDARYLVWVGIPTFRQYLNYLGISDDLIVPHEPAHVIYDVERLIVPSNRNNQAFLDPESLELFSGLRAKYGRPRKPGKKIYISRLRQSSGASTRVMKNEAELIRRLSAMGFQIVAPECLSPAEQIAIISTADLVVGPAGSGMFNLVFCHPGTKVIDIESEPHWIHAHRSLFASCGLEYGIFVGNCQNRSFQQHHQPWTVNIEALVARISAFLKV